MLGACGYLKRIGKVALDRSPEFCLNVLTNFKGTGTYRKLVTSINLVLDVL